MVERVSNFDRRLLAALEAGLPLVSRPYAVLAEKLGVDQALVLERLHALQAEETVKRFGVIVRHHELGYCANAMVVWDVPDEEVSAVGQRLSRQPYVTLCYRRPRRLPLWPYNLFCMIHGRSRKEVLSQISEASRLAGLEEFHRQILFSKRRFKQRGAHYAASRVQTGSEEAAA